MWAGRRRAVVGGQGGEGRAGRIWTDLDLWWARCHINGHHDKFTQWYADGQSVRILQGEIM